MQAIIGKQFPKIIIPKIDEAKQSIKIIVFDWRWYANDPGNPVQLFNQALVRAVRRGVRVQAVVNYPTLVETLKKIGVEAKKISSTNLVHAKLIIIDDTACIVGSHNFSVPAFTTNFEVSLFCDIIEIAEELSKFFDSLWQL